MLDKIKDILTTINNLMAQLIDKTEQLEKMKSENVALKKEVETLKAESAAKDVAVATAKKEAEDAKAELNAANAAVAKATAEAEAAKKEADTAKANLEAKIAEIETLNTSVATLEAENAKLKEELSNIDKGDEEINAIIDEIIVSLEALKVKIDAL